MLDIPEFLETYIPRLPDTRIRGWRGFNASEAGKCPRDLYWSIKKEAITNFPDLKGKANFVRGSALENGFKSSWLDKLHIFGFHLVDYQVSVGGDEPVKWNGIIDFLCLDKTSDPSEIFVCEFKTKWGIGCDFLLKNMIPDTGYSYQLGLYLKDYYDKGKPRDGCLLYWLNSDKNSCEFVQFTFRYLPETNEIECYRVTKTGGYKSNVSYKFSLDYVFKKWEYVLTCLEKNEEPKPEYRYKYPLDPDYLETLSDTNIKNALKGDKILGDWQVVYSPYKNKILQVDNCETSYTENEIKTLEREYLRRHPRSKLDFH